MTDLLIRNVASADVAALDSQAETLGLSRSQYLGRLIHQQAQLRAAEATHADLAWFADTFSDLADQQVTDQAWS